MNKKYYQIIFLFLCLFSLLYINKTKASLPLQGKFILIDVGHGGKDPGTIYKNIYEKDLNLQIAKHLENSLFKMGASVYLLRNGDYDLSNGVKKHRKKADFDNRIKIINKSQGDLYLSIHLNYLPNKIYYGAQVFYNKDNKKIAETIQKHLNNKLKTTREIKKIPSNTYMYSKLNIPGVLIECGFLSNPEERNILVTDEYQEKLSQVITEGIIDYFI